MIKEEYAACPLCGFCLKCSVNPTAGAEAQHKPEMSVATPHSNFSKSAYEWSPPPARNWERLREIIHDAPNARSWCGIAGFLPCQWSLLLWHWPELLATPSTAWGPSLAAHGLLDHQQWWKNLPIWGHVHMTYATFLAFWTPFLLCHCHTHSQLITTLVCLAARTCSFDGIS